MTNTFSKFAIAALIFSVVPFLLYALSNTLTFSIHSNPNVFEQALVFSFLFGPAVALLIAFISAVIGIIQIKRSAKKGKVIILISVLIIISTFFMGRNMLFATPPLRTISTILTPADPNADIQFVLSDSYRAGDIVEVKIKNIGNIAYTYNSSFAACYLQYLDSKGRKFIIPEGTHCDIVMTAEIKPGETVTLFKWDLEECIQDAWGCVRSRPLSPGAYKVRGTFSTKDSTKTVVTEKSIVIQK